MIRVISMAEVAVPSALRRQVLLAQEEAWPSEGEPVLSGPVHDPALEPYSMLLVDDEQLLSALDLLFKTITHAGQVWRAAGLSTVVTPLTCRGCGYGRQLVRHAHDALVDMDVDLALFTCDRPLAGFYEECGFAVLPGTVLEGGTPDEPFRSDQPGFDKVTLTALYSERARAAHADFTGSTVLLHSGEIDKLW